MIEYKLNEQEDETKTSGERKIEIKFLLKRVK